MVVFEGKSTGRVAVARLMRGSDLLQGIQSLAEKVGFRAATVQFIGALSKAVVQILDQDTKQYISHAVPGPVEVVSGTGNVSQKDGVPFAHVHVALAGLDGKCVGGHVGSGTEVYLIELVLSELSTEPPLVRKPDAEIGVAVWK